MAWIQGNKQWGRIRSFDSKVRDGKGVRNQVAVRAQDSQLIVSQVLGEFQVKGECLKSYLEKMEIFLNGMKHYMVKHIL